MYLLNCRLIGHPHHPIHLCPRWEGDVDTVDRVLNYSVGEIRNRFFHWRIKCLQQISMSAIGLYVYQPLLLAIKTRTAKPHKSPYYQCARPLGTLGSRMANTHKAYGYRLAWWCGGYRMWWPSLTVPQMNKNQTRLYEHVWPLENLLPQQWWFYWVWYSRASLLLVSHTLKDLYATTNKYWIFIRFISR